MSAPNRTDNNGSPWLLLSAMGVVLLALVIFYSGYIGGAKFSGDVITERNPIRAVIGVLSDELPWSTASTVIAALVAVVFVLLGIFGLSFWLRTQSSRTRVDKANTYMAKSKDVAFMMEKKATEKAQRFGVESPGLPIAKTLSGQMLYASWEDVSVDIWGPRTGKTTSRAIPGILAAPGAVLATTNKRDLPDATRGVREQQGEVWVFDPQQVADEPATWWWNPLTYVTNDVRAQEMADHFAAATQELGSRKDPFFDPAGRDVLSSLLLAAALSDKPITEVSKWLLYETDTEAVSILKENGYTAMADQLKGHIQTTEKTRSGIFSTARTMASCLTYRDVIKWVTPPAEGENKREFKPAEFVLGRNTLYSLSKEGAGSAGALVTALTVATVTAAEELAKRQGGRLRLPLVVMLDEAANVCRWGQLPNLYSHYGSRGIVINTILQSWSQGVEVWGEKGMNKLWSAANIKIYGGGVSEVDFLDRVSRLIGDYSYISRTQSKSRQGTSNSYDTRTDRTLDVADLGALPRGRAIAFISGAPAVMLKTVPWYEGQYKEAVESSLAKYELRG